MSSDVNEGKRNLLDRAAGVFRGRVAPGSPFRALLDGDAAAAHNSPSQMGKFQGTPLVEGVTNLLRTKRLSRSIELGMPQIGDMPPQPQTLRGRVGAVLAAIVRRTLFWYTDQIKTFQGLVADAAREQVLALNDISARQRQQSAQM